MMLAPVEELALLARILWLADHLLPAIPVPAMPALPVT